jgi:hypothetical protein
MNFKICHSNWCKFLILKSQYFELRIFLPLNLLLRQEIASIILGNLGSERAVANYMWGIH